MQALAALCVRRPVFASVLILSLVVVGAFSFAQLGVDRFPNVDFPTILVTTRLPGAAPEQVETEVTDRIEEAVNTISGIDQLSSTSSEGVSQVVVAFRLEKPVDVAAQDVRDKVNRILPLLPRTVTQPTVEKMDPDAAPVLSLAVSARKPLRDITEYADTVLRRQLESADGVGQVLVVGGRKRQINIWIEAARLRAQNLTVADVSRALQSQNVDVPGGRIEEGARAITLRTRGRVETAEGFGDIVVREVAGHPVRLGDVARIEDGVADAQSLANVNGAPTVVLNIRKQSGTNTVEVVRNVRERIDALRKTVPAGYDLRVVRDQSDFIQASITSVEEHLVVGSLLAALVVLLFLGNLRSTLIAAISIPTSIIATFGLIWYMGFTLNMLTMLALTLAVGIVIDDAIVVLENIYRFIEEKGMPPMVAAVEATREIGLAVMATTLSLVAIFGPVGFMSGIIGRFMKSFGLTMAFAVLVSLLVSFTLTPMMSARWLRVTPRRGDGGHDSKHTRFFAPIDRIYARLLDWAMSHRGIVAVAAVLMICASVPLMRIVPVNFLPQDDQAEFDVSLRAAEGTGLEATEVLANRLAAAIRRLPEVDYTLVTVAGGAAGTLNTATVYVRLAPIERRARDQFAVMAEVRDRVLPPLAVDGSRVSVAASGGGGGGGQSAIQFLVQGPDLKELQRISEALATRARAIPGLVDVDTTLNAGKPEMSVRLDRPKAADLGVQIGDAAEALRLLVGGDAVTTFNDGGEQYEVHLRAEAGDRTSVEGLMGLPLPSTRLGAVALENVATLHPEEAPSDIRRVARQRQVTVTANLLPGASQRAAQEAMAQAASGLGLGPGYRGDFAGQSRELARTGIAFLTAFGLSLIFMYLILAAQFESWLHPVTILLSLPLTLPFALVSLIIFGQSLNVFSALGLLVLFGVVKKNSILQIDLANQLKDGGMSTHDAIVQASRDRLRPILMTTLAFVAGMVPLVLSNGVGSATNHGIGYVIIGGQTLVLLVTLLVTPVAYALFDDLRERRLLVRGFQRLRGRLPAGDAVTPL